MTNQPPTVSRPWLTLSHNGDPYGGGFVATESENRNDRYGVYRGDLGARPRSFWRAYARRNGYRLAEARA